VEEQYTGHGEFSCGTGVGLGEDFAIVPGEVGKPLTPSE